MRRFGGGGFAAVIIALRIGSAVGGACTDGVRLPGTPNPAGGDAADCAGTTASAIAVAHHHESAVAVAHVLKMTLTLMIVYSR